MYRWRNHVTTRERMRTTTRIGMAEHWRWFKGAIGSPTHLPMLAWEDGRRVGYVLINFKDGANTTAEVSIAVAPRLRGRGIGTRILDELAVVSARHYSSVRLVAVVKRSNGPSLRSFRKSGFTTAVFDQESEFIVLEKRC